MSSGNPATEFSVALLGQFVRLGVRDIVLSPGSRSQALALAAAEYERAGLIHLHVRVDERVGGFLALGIAVETGTPVAVITTSGTAVANLYPAVLEAHHSGVPLILLTADRPDELRGIGSNQTTSQSGLFGSAVRLVRDIAAPGGAGVRGGGFPAQIAAEAMSAATGYSSVPGPVHLNLAFREPLSGTVGPIDLGPAGFGTENTDGTTDQRLGRGPTLELVAAPHTLVVAGHGAGEQAEAVARALGAPLAAEVSSGARFGPQLVAAYRELLNEAEFGGRVQRVIVFGHPTLSREIPALIQRDGVETIVVRGNLEDYNPGHRVRVFAESVVVVGEPDADRSWTGRWVSANRTFLETDEISSLQFARTDDPKDVAQFARAQMEVFRQPVTRRMLVEAVWRASWPHDRLVFGASRLIREADRVVAGKKITVHSNRGLGGIDGTVATAIGIALASQAAEQNGGRSPLHASGGVTRVLLGDLALLHDVGSLLIGGDEPRPRMQIIVGNDGGGTIFDGLEVAASSAVDAFDRVMFTPQSVDFSALAAAYGWGYRRATNRGELDEALVGSPAVIEVPLAR